MIKVFTTNERGNIELPKEVLEQLLQEAYDEGRRMSGTCERPSVDEVTKPITINPSPYITWTTSTPYTTNTITTSATNITNATQATNFPRGDQ